MIKVPKNTYYDVWLSYYDDNLASSAVPASSRGRGVQGDLEGPQSHWQGLHPEVDHDY